MNSTARVRRTRFAAVLVAALALLASVAILASADESSASSHSGEIGTTGISYYMSDSDITLGAGGEISVSVILTNSGSEIGVVSIDVSAVEPRVSASLNNSAEMLSIPANDSTTISITVTADRFASEGTYTLEIVFTVLMTGSASVSATEDRAFTVTSDLSSSGEFNKFMGIFPNTLSSPFDGAWFSSLVTAICWLLIGYVIMMIAIPIFTRICMKKGDPEAPTLKRSLAKMCTIVIVLNAIGRALRVVGVNEEVINSINVIFYICYILVGALVAWKIYTAFVDVIVKRIGKKELIPGGSRSDMESFRPLFIYLGEIVFAVVVVMSIMSLLGFNLTAIITSAGIVSLGITMGAQSILGQFFSGLVILSTRPFKKGDLIMIGSSTVTYRVRKVNIMNTELENWDNSDITVVPNSTITDSNVKNLTRDTLKTKIHVFISVAYGTDLSKARALMLEVANMNPRIIKDGSVDRPYTRVMDFEDSNISLRLSVYVDDVNDSGSIGGELRQTMYNKFCEAGISIDYPTVVLHMADPASPTGGPDALKQ